jgi:hypothetical protein
MSTASLHRTLILCFVLDLFACDRTRSTAEAPAVPATVAHPTARDAGPSANRVSMRQVVTVYRWQSTEPGTAATGGQSIEHGSPLVHLVFEVHRDRQDRGWVQLGALAGGVAIPESTRMRPVSPTATWHVPSDVHNEFTLEQTGAQFRGDEPIRVFLAGAPVAPQDIVPGEIPTTVRVPQSDTLPANPRAAVGQYDAIVVAVIPVTNHHGGRYLVYALDLLPQFGGFPASGVMTRMPTAQDLDRYGRWMRDPNGMARDRTPPIAMMPIDRS